MYLALLEIFHIRLRNLLQDFTTNSVVAIVPDPQHVPIIPIESWMSSGRPENLLDQNLAVGTAYHAILAV